MGDTTTLPWSPGACRVPMWYMGGPAGHCGEPTFGPQLPMEVLSVRRGWSRLDRPYCFGPCCPNHGGPKEGEPIVFQDGLTAEGRPMWCAVSPGFIDLQSSPAGFSGNPLMAIHELKRLELEAAALRMASVFDEEQPHA